MLTVFCLPVGLFISLSHFFGSGFLFEFFFKLLPSFFLTVGNQAYSSLSVCLLFCFFSFCLFLAQAFLFVVVVVVLLLFFFQACLTKQIKEHLVKCPNAPHC